MTRKAVASALAPSLLDQRLQRLASELAPLPPFIRYYDEYADVTRSIASPAALGRWTIESSGKRERLNFDGFPITIQPLLRSWGFWLLGCVEPRTTVNYFNGLRSLADEHLIDILGGILDGPQSAKEFWIREVYSKGLTVQSTFALRSFLYFVCDIGLGGWTAEHRGLVRGLPTGLSSDKFRTVRDGAVFLSFLEERKIVEHFDDLAQRIRNGDVPADDRTLAASCLLYWVYAHGVRPIQVANRNLNDVRLRRVNSGPPIVHLTFRYAKQRANNKRAEDTRTMKRDWAWIMDAWVERRSSRPLDFQPDRAESLFGYTPADVTQAVADLTERLTGVRRTPTELRHTAAQRMVDAGASALELAEFMMHHDVDTGQVYYDISPTQADRINKVLGLSPVYAELADIVRTRVIDKARLLGLPDDQQIGAAPHGRPIVGIGGCGLGQSLCSKNPGLSCYECSKFMPLDEPAIHREARDAVAATVKEFIDAARPEEGNPAFMQLRRTLECIDAVIDGLDPPDEIPQ